MSNKETPNARNNPQIQEDLILTVEQQGGFFSLPMVRQGTVAVILRNGRVDQIIGPGRSLMFRLPFQSVETFLVDTKIRNLNIISQGEFLTADHWRVNISLWLSYRVTDPARIAVEYAQPVHALYSTVKDLLGRVISRQDFQTLSQTGRQIVRQEVLAGNSQLEQTLGIALTDVRIDDLTLPERVGTALDGRQVAQMEGEAEQWRLRGKWQDMPESVRRSHFQEHLVEGAMFVNPPLPGAVMGQGMPGAPQLLPPAPGVSPPGGQIIEGQAAPTRMLSAKVWGQLVVVSGPKQGVIFPLRSPLVTLGRAGDNDIVLQDSSVSGHHARIEQRGAQSFVVDANSSNGTFVNGQRITQAQLTGGEVILMGDTHLRFEIL
ncbi:MAG: SPFH domain-containing protein [Chloroflexota bacterium]|nr:SPFH domain-containing protein [Chloroflexota bacterium]